LSPRIHDIELDLHAVAVGIAVGAASTGLPPRIHDTQLDLHAVVALVGIAAVAVSVEHVPPD
jgi:hypothetical protein